MPKYSFRDPVTGVLKAWGYVETNVPGDIRQEEPEDFAPDQLRGFWRWDGTVWRPYVPPTIASKLRAALDDAKADPGIPPKLQRVLAALAEVTP